jgi:hypothetical protein
VIKRIVITAAVAALALTGCEATEDPAPIQAASPGQPDKSEGGKKTFPIKLAASRVAFKPGPLATGSNYTSVKVTITNNTGKVLEINPLFFAITATDGTKHEADALGSDPRQIDMGKLSPGEKATGVITAEGKFTPKTVTFTQNGFGEQVRAQVA